MFIRLRYTSPLFKESKILKFLDKISPESCLFINKYFIKFYSQSLKIIKDNTKLYDRNSVNISAIYKWNYLEKINESNLFYQLSPSKPKIIIKKTFFHNYS